MSGKEVLEGMCDTWQSSMLATLRQITRQNSSIVLPLSSSALLFHDGFMAFESVHKIKWPAIWGVIEEDRVKRNDWRSFIDGRQYIDRRKNFWLPTVLILAPAAQLFTARRSRVGFQLNKVECNILNNESRSLPEARALNWYHYMTPPPTCTCLH